MLRPPQAIFRRPTHAQTGRWALALLAAFAPACSFGFDSGGLNEQGPGTQPGDAGAPGGGSAGGASSGSAGAGSSGGAGSDGGAGGTGGASGTSGAGGAGSTGGAGGGEICRDARPNVCAPDTLEDPENCCMVGRSCQGGTCQEGECGQMIAGGAPTPLFDVVVAGGKVFWSGGDSAKVFMAPVGGGSTSDQVTNDGSNFVARLAADATHVYFTGYFSGRILRMPVEGGDLEIVAEIPAPAPPEPPPANHLRQIAVGGGFVFWQMSNPPGLYYASLANLPAEPKLLDDDGAAGVTTDESYVYWSTANGEILRLPLTADLSGEPQTVVAGQQTDSTDIGVFGDRVFWSRFEYVYSALKNGTNASIVTIHDDEMGEARGVASDGTHVFISAVNRGDTPGGLFRFPLLGGKPVKIASTTNVGEVRNVVLDCDTLFVANTIDHTVLKVAR